MAAAGPGRVVVARSALLAGLLLVAMGLWAVPASALGPAAVFGPGYDSYLGAEQRGITAASLDSSEGCPSEAVVEGWTAWHFIIDAPTEFAALDAAFTLEGTDVTVAGLTARTTAQWATFNPAEHFIATPGGHDAYVYTPGPGVLLDAASRNSPDSPGPVIVVDRTCGATPTAITTTAPTTAPTTTAPTATAPTTGPSVTLIPALVITNSPPVTTSVLAVVITRSLATTGPSGSLYLTIAGGVLILAGLVSLRLSRTTAPSGPSR